MADLDPAEERVRQILIEQAEKTDPRIPRRALITYGDLCVAVDPNHDYWKPPRYRGIGDALRHVSTYEHEHDRPLLSALVVRKLTMRPGDGFGSLGRDLGFDIPSGGEHMFWLEKVEEVVSYWTGPGKNGVEPAVRTRSRG